MAVAVALLMIGGEFDLSSGVMTGATAILIGLMSAYFTGHGHQHRMGDRHPRSSPPAPIGWFNGSWSTRPGLPSFIVTLASFFVLPRRDARDVQAFAGKVQVGDISEADGSARLQELDRPRMEWTEFQDRDALFVGLVHRRRHAVRLRTARAVVHPPSPNWRRVHSCWRSSASSPPAAASGRSDHRWCRRQRAVGSRCRSWRRRPRRRGRSLQVARPPTRNGSDPIPRTAVVALLIGLGLRRDRLRGADLVRSRTRASADPHLDGDGSGPCIAVLAALSASALPSRSESGRRCRGKSPSWRHRQAGHVRRRYCGLLSMVTRTSRRCS